MESSNKDRTPEETYLADRDSKAGNVSRRFPNMLSRFRKKSSEENVVAETPLDEMTSKQTLEVGNIEKGEFEEGTGDQAGFKGKHDPFNSTEDAKVYKTMTWLHAGFVMIAETISLGILALPSALATLGLVPGIILVIVLGVMATYTGLVIHQFKQKYPHVHSMADAGEVLLGPWGREIFGIAQIFFFVLIMASHILTFGIMMNTITHHGACTIVFAVAALIISILCSLPRTLKNVAYMSITSFISIGAAVILTMVGISISRPGMGQINYSTQTSFHVGFSAVLNIVFAYAGHVAFFGFISELKDAKDFPKALCLLQISDTSLYIVAAIVIYWFAGNDVKSPALDSAGPTIRKIAYGLAIPTIVISGVINGHAACKYLFVRFLRNGDQMGKKSLFSWGVWAGIATTLWVIAFLVAEAVPVFNDLLGITSALFASWFTYGLPGLFWLYMNKELFTKKGRWTWKKGMLAALNIFNVVAGAMICIAGVYTSAMQVGVHAAEAGPGGGVFSCKDNSIADIMPANSTANSTVNSTVNSTSSLMPGLVLRY